MKRRTFDGDRSRLAYLARDTHRFRMSGHHLYLWLWSWVVWASSGERRWEVGIARGSRWEPSGYWQSELTFTDSERARCLEEFEHVVSVSTPPAAEELVARGWVRANSAPTVG